MNQIISRKAVYRLSQYSRSLQDLLAQGVNTVSSDTLAAATGVKSPQIRKDLAMFGQFGRPGLGYPVESLLHSVTQVLGTNRLQPVILVGAGNLGSALLGYDGFAKEGFEVLAGFDADSHAFHQGASGTPVLPMEQLPAFVKMNQIRMAILCVPGGVAQEVTNLLVASGIEAILNFAPVLLKVPETVMVNNVNLAVELENLSYFLRD